MARIDFYVLSQSGEQARQLFACRLAEKAYKLEHTVHILAADEATASRIDELLWTFRDGSFVPHEMVNAAGDRPAAPVSVGFDPGYSGHRDLLINLDDGIPACAQAFPRIAELVTSDEDSKQKSRRRFVAYRDEGHELETHRV
jgi:DNA polymerase III subunit chi